MEISKMLTLSTAHIKRTTADWLDSIQNEIVVYPKDEYGWFIYLSTEMFEEINLMIVPYDLIVCIQFALDNDCLWLCLDRDGEIVDELDQYNW